LDALEIETDRVTVGRVETKQPIADGLFAATRPTAF
jgi:hypothetical protein